MSVLWEAVLSIEEGRAGSKSPHQKFGYFLSMSQQAVSAESFQIQLLECFPQKQKEQRQKQLGYSTVKVVTTLICKLIFAHLATLKFSNS